MDRVRNMKQVFPEGDGPVRVQTNILAPGTVADGWFALELLTVQKTKKGMQISRLLDQHPAPLPAHSEQSAGCATMSDHDPEDSFIRHDFAACGVRGRTVTQRWCC